MLGTQGGGSFEHPKHVLGTQGGILLISQNICLRYVRRHFFSSVKTYVLGTEVVGSFKHPKHV